jgi:hypothetical protein
VKKGDAAEKGEYLTRPVYYAALFALYATTIAVFFIIPVGRNFGGVLLGSAVFRHDAVLNAGILEWGYRSLWSSRLHFFDWPAGFPLRNALAGTENLFGWQFVYSPLRVLGASVAGAYNAALLSSLLISGIGAASLARHYGASQFGGAIAGLAFAFNPFHVDHMIHLQTMSVCWSPFALLGLDMVLAKSSVRAHVMLGAGFMMTVLCGMYFGVFLTMVLIMYALITWIAGRQAFSWVIVRDLALTALVCGLMLSPILIHYVEFARAYGAYPHSSFELSLASLPITGIATVPNWLSSAALGFPLVGAAGWFTSAFPGVVVLATAMWALFARSQKRAAIVGPLIALALICWLLALGPTVELRGGVPSPLLTSLPLPGKLWLAISAIRWPMRIFMYSVLCLSLLAGLGATSLMKKFSGGQRIILQALLALSLILEARPSQWLATRSTVAIDPMRMSDAYPFLAAESDTGGVVELPSRIDSGLVTPYATRYAYASAGHLRKVVAFHGSLFPPVADSLRTSTYQLPAADAIRMMKAHGVTRLVIHNELMSRDSSAYLKAAFTQDQDSIVFESTRSTVFALKR